MDGMVPAVNGALWPQWKARNTLSQECNLRVLKTATLCHYETPNTLGVVGFLKAYSVPLRSLGNVESTPPKPVNAQTARDRGKNKEPMSLGQSVSKK